MELSPAVAPAPGKAPPRSRIMIVDDDPVVSGMLGVSLGAAGYEIIEAHSGEAALDIIAKSNSKSLPDIVFLDIEMWDGIDGFEVCRRLKANPVACHIPIIFLTARNEAGYEQLGLALGAVDYISKPISSPIVRARARTHLALTQQSPI